MATAIEWSTELLKQLTWHYDEFVRPRLQGLTDDEYFWEPVQPAWSIRPRGEARTPQAAGGGDLVADFVFPEPSPAPFTTIAWRLAHVTIGVFGMRCASHFGGPAVDYQHARYPASAAEALTALDENYQRWVDGVSACSNDDLAEPVGDTEPFPESPLAGLVLHIHREAIHHLSEVLLIRDLYRLRR